MEKDDKKAFKNGKKASDGNGSEEEDGENEEDEGENGGDFEGGLISKSSSAGITIVRFGERERVKLMESYVPRYRVRCMCVIVLNEYLSLNSLCVPRYRCVCMCVFVLKNNG
jgi:hypothetical protein